ncbi:hypothetical protein MB0529_00539 [Bacteroides fragilis]|uniref:hypothetical protein n=1 Tax=Bacteroides fragilis TaxID=817 RepID=UPI0006A66D2B|nr:hypothetical protein [Bacteroides fragilis]CUA17198.1 hypothetical protein MB0529_00539 [Bacteroides fragilis]
MRNEENPRAGGSETGDACRQNTEFKSPHPSRNISETVSQTFPVSISIREKSRRL